MLTLLVKIMYDLVVSHKLVSASLSLTRSVAHNLTPSVSFLLPLREVSLSLAIYGLAFTHSRCSHFSVFSLSVFSLLCALALILSLSVFFCVFLLCVLVCIHTYCWHTVLTRGFHALLLQDFQRKFQDYLCRFL